MTKFKNVWTLILKILDFHICCFFEQKVWENGKGEVKLKKHIQISKSFLNFSSYKGSAGSGFLSQPISEWGFQVWIQCFSMK